MSLDIILQQAQLLPNTSEPQEDSCNQVPSPKVVEPWSRSPEEQANDCNLSSSPKPLDLSMGDGGPTPPVKEKETFTTLAPTLAGHCSVIHSPVAKIQPPPMTSLEHPISLMTTSQAEMTDMSSAFSPVKSVLPTCTNSNLNSNWIAMKFGAAVGPNRMSYPREFKLMVIDYYYANGANKYRTCKEFQITKSMLNGWLQKIEKIKQSRPGSLKSGRSGRRPQFPDIEKQLYSLYQAHLVSGQKVGNRWIRETARNLAKQQCTADELAGMCQFSERWLSNFKKRYRINLNRDWSSGSSQASSSSCSSAAGHEEAVVSECPPDVHSTKMDDGEPGALSPTAMSTSVVASHHDSDDLSDDGQLSIQSGEEVHSPTSPSAQSFPEVIPVPSASVPADAVVSQPDGGLPLHQFYRQYPWLCRRPATLNYEPGRRGRKVQFPQVERVLYDRLLQRQASGQRVSNRWLQEEARSLASKLCPEVLAEATKSARCMFSEHWLHNFKKRYGVSLKQQLVTSGCASVATPLALQAAASISSPRSSLEVPEKRLPDTPIKPLQPIAQPAATPANSGALAAVLQMQQLLLQQYYLSSLAATSSPVSLAPHEPNNNKTNLGQNLLAAGVNLAEWYSKAANGGLFAAKNFSPELVHSDRMKLEPGE